MIAYCLVCIRVQDASGPRCILPGFIRQPNARTRCRAHGQRIGLVSVRFPRNPLLPRPHHPASRPSVPCPPPMGEYLLMHTYAHLNASWDCMIVWTTYMHLHACMYLNACCACMPCMRHARMHACTHACMHACFAYMLLRACMYTRLYVDVRYQISDIRYQMNIRSYISDIRYQMLDILLNRYT